MLAPLLAAVALAAPPPQTALSVTLWPEGRDGGVVHRWTLRCRPLGGNLPLASRACRVLDDLGDAAFRPIPKNAACTQVYGGPEEALVTGRHRGRKIWMRFRQRDGCEIARWRRHQVLFQIGGGT